MTAETIDHSATPREKETTMMGTDRAGRRPSPWRGVRGRLLATCLAMVTMLVLAASAHAAEFGIEPGSFQVDVSTTQAGAHPDITTKFTLNTESGQPVDNVKDIRVKMPPGLIGNPQAYPMCKPSQFPACPTATQVGTVNLKTGLIPTIQAPIYNMEPAQGKVAQFAFLAAVVQIQISADIRTDGDYGLTMTIPDTPTLAPLIGNELTFWGNPASPAHDLERQKMCVEFFPGMPTCSDVSKPPPGGGAYPPYPATGGVASGTPERPFMVNPPACGQATTVTLEANSWQNPNRFVSDTAPVPAMTGCDKVKFQPTLSVRPGSSEAGAPTSLAVDIDIPQYDNPNGIAAPPLRNAVVRLPKGMTISPSAADGLQGCTNAQVGLGSKTPAACPRGSEIGTASITSPLMAEPMTGRIYLGSPTPQQMLRMFLVVEGGGVLLKLEGTIDADPATGRLTTTFADQPMLAASKISLRFAGGSRAVLSNPGMCGTYTADGDLSSWSSGAVVRRTSSFALDQGCEKGRAFTPSVVAGVTNPIAGASSPFTFTLIKPDGQPNVQSMDIVLPQGLLARLSEVPLCAEAQAVAGTCAATSQVGHATIGVGPGSHPVSIPQAGKAPTGVYLAGPYKGAPFSLVIKVPAQAGPFDLGLVLVRAALNVDASKAQVTVKSDPLPQMLKGIPVQYRSINITMDRPGFMINPTSCAVQSVGSTITSAAGQRVPAGSRFQVGECASTPLSPELDLQLTGEGQTRDGSHPGLVATLFQQRGESGLSKVEVALPLSVALDPDNAAALCTPEQAQARACPAKSIVGHASVRTPALHEPLTGPVYFVEGRRTTATGKVRKTLPKLWLKLEGQGVPLDLWASSDVDEDDRLVTTFENIPDAPITAFLLKIDGGKNGILAGTQNICAASNRSDAVFTGQTGKVTDHRLRVAVEDCPTALVKTTTSKRSVTLRLSGLGAGTLTLDGDRIARSKRTLKSAKVASITGRLTRAARRALARDGKVTVKVTATFNPKGEGKTVKVNKTVTIRRKKSR